MRRYEISNHLGNVLATYTDRKLWRKIELQDGTRWTGYDCDVASGTDYHAYGFAMAGRTWEGGDSYRWGFNGTERAPEHGGYTTEFRENDVAIGRWWSIDPINHEWQSPYGVNDGNPIKLNDVLGASTNDYYIHSNGKVEYVDTGKKDKYYHVNDKSEKTYLFETEKNTKGLVQIPKNFVFTNDGKDAGFTTKKGNDDRMFINPRGLAGLCGAVIQANVNDVVINQFSYADGRSPSPSTSHKNGLNGDLRYLRTDKTGGPCLVSDNNFDKDRNEKLTNALFEFGWTKLLSHKHNDYLLPHSQHYDKSNHANHLHLQGWKPKTLNLSSSPNYKDSRANNFILLTNPGGLEFNPFGTRWLKTN